MSKLKRFASVLLALVMCFGLTVTAFADEPDTDTTATATTYSITINNSTKGYEYTAYQVFKGDYDSDSGVLSNIVWGDNITTEITVNEATVSIYDALAEISYKTTNPNDETVTMTVYPFKKTNPNYDSGDSSSLEYIALTSAAEVAEILATCSEDDAVLQNFADVIANYITGNAAGTSTGDYDAESGDFKSTYTISGLTAGYYLVETTDLPSTGYNSGDNGGYTRYILLQTVEDGAEKDTKSDVPTVDKTLDKTDANISDTITYTLAATLPTNYDDYEAYKLIFHDTLSGGLTFNNNSVTVTVYSSISDYKDKKDGKVVSSGYTVVTNCYHEVSISAFDTGITYYTYSEGTYTAVDSGAEFSGETTYYVKDDCSFEVSIADTKALTDSDDDTISTSSSSVIAVTFTATLNEDAVIAGEGNPNEVYLEYSNNPNSGGEGSTGTTPEDKVVTWTYEVDVTKVDGNSYDEDDEEYKTMLPGAEFVLYRQINDLDGDESADIEYVIVDSSGKVTGWTPYLTEDEATEAGKTAYASTLISGDDGIFKVIGLDVGTYYLEETKAPSGYNTLSTNPIELTITATHTTTDNTSTSETTINTIDYLKLDELETTEGAVTTSGDDDGNTLYGAINVTIENNKGASMPSTGGIGTTIFYVVGGVLVVGAVVLLITRKRMQDDQ